MNDPYRQKFADGIPVCNKCHKPLMDAGQLYVECETTEGCGGAMFLTAADFAAYLTANGWTCEPPMEETE